jgi:phosphoglycolate phosphatase
MMSNSRYKLLIFDWDGTLIDSEAKIVSCIQRAIKFEKMAEKTYQDIRNVIGLELEVLVGTLFPGTGQKKVDAVMKGYYKYFFSENASQSQPFPDVKKAICSLSNQGFLMAIATGKNRRSFESELSALDMKKYFSVTKTAEETDSKPSPMMVKEIVAECNVAPSQVLIIGDSIYDIEMAKNAEIDVLAVACGVHDSERLLKYNPVGLIQSVADLPSWLNK